MRFSRLSVFAALLSLGSLPSVRAQFGPEQMFFCQGPRSMALADLEGDGDLDLMVGYRQGLSVYYNLDGQGQFGTATTVVSSETVGCTIDVDQDGLPDLVGSREMGEGIFLYHNNGLSGFGNGVLIVPGASANEIMSTDLDGDGDQDLVWASDDHKLVVSYNFNATGGFSAPLVLAQLADLAYVDAVDMDGDLDPDLVYSSTTVDEVHWCKNIQGTFDTPALLSFHGHGVARDLDNDGRMDLLLANVAQDRVVWQRNTGDNNVLGWPETIDAVFLGPGKADACDVDGDGDLDVVVTSSVTDEVAWFENTDGHGGFGPRQTVGFGLPQVYAFVSGDVDNDGDGDLFVGSVGLDKVVWYTNLHNTDGRMMGRVFNDLNNDGLFNGNDHGMMNIRVEADGLGATYTNASGLYWFDVAPGNYTVTIPPIADWAVTTTDSYDVTVPVDGSADDNDFGLHSLGVSSEMSPTLGSSPMRCGLDISYWGSVSNTGNQVSDVKVTLQLDPLSTFVSADPEPSSIVNGVPTWDLIGLQPTQQRQIHMVVHLPGSDHVGAVLHDQLVAQVIGDGQPLSTDAFAYEPVLLCAIDPNDKLVLPEGVGPEHLTPMDSKLTYTIRFQNTGNAEAWDVAIVDTLDAGLDLSTLRVLSSSHAHHSLLSPDGVLRFDFPNINLPDSASDPTGSQGFVRFSIEPMDGMAEGTLVHNRAGIYFDSNAPVVTNTTLNTFSSSPVGIEESVVRGGDITVYPNPAQGPVTVRLGEQLHGRVTVDLMDATGRTVRSITRRSSTLVLEADGLPDGVYLVRATDERGMVRTARVVFQR